MTLFGGYCDDSVSAGIWVLHIGAKSGGKLVTLFGGCVNNIRELHCIIIFQTVLWCSGS